MPGKRNNKAKSDPIPVPKSKGVLEIVLPVKNTEVKPPVMYDYFKNNASYSENNDNSMDEETKLLKLQIEQRLSEILPVSYETKVRKTDNESTTANVEDNKKSNRKSTDACINIFCRAVSQIEGVAKKAEKEKMLGVVAKPKRDILVPLEKCKKEDEDYFRGTKNVKEKKVKPKKETKVICFDSNEVAFNPAPVIEIQPVVVNRWQEKEGSKLFTTEMDEEEEMLQIAIKESMKTARLEKERQIQEELLYHELTREAKKSKSEGRGSKIQNAIKEKIWGSTESGSKSCDRFDSKVDEIKRIPIPGVDNSWDDEIDLVRQEIDERKAKKERVKKNLKERLKLLDNYEPLSDDEKKEETVVVKEKKEVTEKFKTVKTIGDEVVEELEFVDVSDEEEPKKIEVSQVKSHSQDYQNASERSDILLKKKMESLTFNDIEENDDELQHFKNEKSKLKVDGKPRLHHRETYWNSSVEPLPITGLPPRSQRPASERRKPEIESPAPNENIFEEPSAKTVKAPDWNSTAKSENRGFSKEYQAKRKETLSKVLKSSPSKSNFEVFAAKDIPQIDDAIGENIEGPFKDFDVNVPKPELNDLSGEKNDIPNDKNVYKSIPPELVFHYLQQILFEQEKLRNPLLQCNNQNLISNFQQMPNTPNLNVNQFSDLTLLNSLQQTSGLNLSDQVNMQQSNNLNLSNVGLQQASNLNFFSLLNNAQQASSVNSPDVTSVQQCQIPNIQQATGLNLTNNLQQPSNLDLLNFINNTGLQQANCANLPDMASIQTQNLQQSTGLNVFNNPQEVNCVNLPDVTNNQQCQIPNLQQATALNVSNSVNSQEITNEQYENPQQPPAENSKEIEELTLKVIELQEALAKEKEERLQLEQSVELQNQAQADFEEQVEEELDDQEMQPMEGNMMRPMVIPNPYLQYQQMEIPSPGIYSNQVPVYYPVIPPASHLPPPPWAAPTPYMGPMVYRPPFHMRGPQ